MDAPPSLPQPAAGGYAARFSASDLIRAAQVLPRRHPRRANGGGSQRGEVGDGRRRFRSFGPMAAGATSSWGWHGGGASGAGGRGCRRGGRADSPYQGYEVQWVARWLSARCPSACSYSAWARRTPPAGGVDFRSSKRMDRGI